MDRVQEIEDDIRNLPPEDYRRLMEHLRDLDDQRWVAQMDEDAASGKLDFLLEEAESEAKEGKLRDWPQGA